MTPSAHSGCVTSTGQPSRGGWGGSPCRGDGPHPAAMEPQELLVCVRASQPLLFPLDANCNGVFRNRSISPSGLLDATISEEVRPGHSLEEEQEAQKPLSGGTGRRHTLAEVSTCFSPSAPPCKCPRGSGRRARWAATRRGLPPADGERPLSAGHHLIALILLHDCTWSFRGRTAWGLAAPRGCGRAGPQPTSVLV